MSTDRGAAFQQPSFEIFDDEPLDDLGNPTYSVLELADAVNAQLRRGFPDGVWVRGEIDGFRSSGPHSYFSLVEHDERGKAVVNISLFAPAKNRLTPLLKKHHLRLGDGMKVRIFGHLDYYGPNGRLGVKMSGIDPRFTLGELSIARDQVVRTLVASGLYDANRRRHLPLVPLRIGVVTSLGTAAWHDFENELQHSGFGFELTVCDTRVQGDGASDSVAAAIRTLGRRAGLDAVVVIRGGGARNELAVFDAEPIATAIATSALPVITGLGHEIDRSIADEVAHTETKTPTAAAGFLIAAVRSFSDDTEQAWTVILDRAEALLRRSEGGLDSHGRSFTRAVDTALTRAGDRLGGRRRRVAVATRGHLAAADRRLDQSGSRLSLSAERSLHAAGLRISTANDRLVGQGRRSIDEAQRGLDGIAARVRLADPVHLLRRGWTITRDAEGGVVRSAASVDPGTLVTTTTADGTFASRVTTPAAESET